MVSVATTKNRPFASGSLFEKSPLPDSNRRPPPYHGGFALLLSVLGTALVYALSLHSGWFLRLQYPFLEVPSAAPESLEPVPRT
jgi:hypothetical protein